MRMPNSIARRLITGSTPGMPRQTGQVWVLGGAPKVVAQPQNIFERVEELRVDLEPDDRLVRRCSCRATGSGRARPPVGAGVPGGGLLVGVGDAEQRGLVEGAADELEPDRQPRRVKPHGTEIAGQPGQAAPGS